jgi:hypothetical protein
VPGDGPVTSSDVYTFVYKVQWPSGVIVALSQFTAASASKAVCVSHRRR